jgi:hypothetical protein
MAKKDMLLVEIAEMRDELGRAENGRIWGIVGIIFGLACFGFDQGWLMIVGTGTLLAGGLAVITQSLKVKSARQLIEKLKDKLEAMPD